MQVKIASGWSAEGGSTFSLMELCDLFNENGIDCTFYGPHDWHLDKCSKADKIQNLKIEKEDILIPHFMDVPEKLPCKKVIFSCHEKAIFVVKHHNLKGVDKIRYVSEDQMLWQGVDGVVIPNLVRGITESKNKPEGIAGIIGTVNPVKGVHTSIERALKDGCKEVHIYGNCNDQNYFKSKIEPLLLKKEVVYKGMEMDRQKIYDNISCVYQSNIDSVPESFGRVRAECIRAGIPYHGNDSATTPFELWEETKVLSEWKELMEI